MYVILGNILMERKTSYNYSSLTSKTEAKKITMFVKKKLEAMCC